MFGYGPFQTPAYNNQWGSGFGYPQFGAQFGTQYGAQYGTQYGAQPWGAQPFASTFGAPTFGAQQFGYAPFGQAPQKRIKLIYFDSKGRAEVSRLALHIGGIDFEDERVDREHFKNNVKATVPFGQLPVLEVDGQQLAQSIAILRFVGRLTNLYPSDSHTAAKVDEVLYLLEEPGQNIRRAMAGTEDNEEKKKEATKKIAEEILPKYFGFLEKLLQKSGSGFFTHQFSVADLAAYHHVSSVIGGERHFKDVPADVLDKFPLLKEHQKRIGEHPKVKEWNAAHPPKQA